MSTYDKDIETKDWYNLRTSNHVSPVFDQSFGRYM